MQAWAIASAPLVLGFDLTNATRMELAWPTISNKRAMAVSQCWESSRPDPSGTVLKVWQAETQPAVVAGCGDGCTCVLQPLLTSKYQSLLLVVNTVANTTQHVFRRMLTRSSTRFCACETSHTCTHADVSTATQIARSGRRRSSARKIPATCAPSAPPAAPPLPTRPAGRSQPQPPTTSLGRVDSRSRRRLVIASIPQGSCRL
jgi:hypothetical protein